MKFNREDLVPEALLADGFDDAIIGTDKDGRVIYDVDQCTSILVNEQGMSLSEAIEYLEFNTICAYVGEMTPIWLYPL